MKKIISVVVLVMLLSLCALPMLAAEETVLTVTSDVLEVNQSGIGTEIQFTVSISGDTPFRALGFGLDFDESVFEYVEGSGNTASVPNTTINKFDDAKKKYALSMEEASYSGTLLTFRLKLKEEVKLDQYTVTLSAAKVTYGDNSQLECKVNGAQITVKCLHDYEWSAVKDTDTHVGVCKHCGDTKTEEHDWEEGETIAAATCTEEGQVKHVCLICKEEKIVTVPATGHKDMDVWKSDGTNHWHECSVCGHKEDETAHTPGTAPTDTEGQVCTECGYEIQPPLGHQYSSEWRQDGTNHWHQCTTPGCGSLSDYGKHVYTDACDITCNVCGLVRMAPHRYSDEWRADERGHYHVCTLCGQEEEIIPHEPGDPATEDTPQTCTVCGFILQMPLGHEHTYGEKWVCDETGHWHTCTDLSCGEAGEKEEHIWGETVTGEDGKKTKTCTVCGYVTEDNGTSETQPGTNSTQPSGSDPGSSSTPTKPSNPTNPSDPNQQDDGFPWWLLAVAAVVLLCVGIVLLVIEIIRSRKVNMHGKFSK